MQIPYTSSVIGAYKTVKTLSLPGLRTIGSRHWRLSDININWLQLLTILIVGVVLLPIAYLVIRAAGAGEEGIVYLLKERTLRIVWNSLTLVLAVTISAAIIGVPFAWITSRTNLPLRRMWLVLGVLPMVIPSYLGAVTFIAAFGPKGMLQGVLDPLGIQRLPELYGFFGAWIVLTLFTYPYVALTVRAALLQNDPALEEAARSMGLSRWKVFWRVTLPQLRPALAAGMLLTALYTLSDFGAVAMMRYNAFTRAIYLQYNSSFNRERAALLALVLVFVTIALLFLQRKLQNSKHNYRIGTGAKRQLKRINLDKWKWPALGFCSVLVGLGVLVPMLVLFTWLTSRNLLDAVPVSMTELAANTIGVSVLAAIVVAIMAIPPAMLAVRSQSRFNHLLARLTHLSYVLPGIVVALALVFFAANAVPAFYQTLPLLILGYATRYLAYGVSATESTLTQINPHIEEAARSMGLSPMQVARRITMPLARNGILAGAVLVCLHVMKELPTTLVLAPIGFKTFATRIWAMYEEAMLVNIAIPGLLLMGVAALLMTLMLWRDKEIVA